ncbi:MAG: hypothetical protein M1825_003429 [Sarcosagium campestre]|nr:MAG: hypothetical protein M1825_003429 [Sarcosagium campestre]
MEALQAVRELYQDLKDLSDSGHPILEQVLAQLEEGLELFKKLLDQDPKSDKSRQTLLSGKITIDDVEYSVNDDFKHGTIKLADTLNLDELESARLFLSAQQDAETLDRSILQTAVIRYHERREYLLECVRLIFLHAADDDAEDGFTGVFKGMADAITNTGATGNAHSERIFPQQCHSAMSSIEKWLQDLRDKIQAASISGEANDPSFTELMDMQQKSLTRQHESLGAILCHLVQTHHTTLQQFHDLLSETKRFDRYDSLLVHYIPALGSYIAEYGAHSPDTRPIHDKFVTAQDSEAWKLADFQAAATTWWLSEYSERFQDVIDQPPSADTHRADVESDEGRSKIFFSALERGAFDFTLSVCFAIGPVSRHDFSVPSLRRWLQRPQPAFQPDSIVVSDHFRLLLMEHLVAFVDSFIAHMPETVRRLRRDEDRSRVETLKNPAASLSPLDYQKYELEKFLVIMAFAFEKRPDAARDFWQDSETNIYGFIQWVSKRLSPPLACALCEVLLAMSEGEDNASATHAFLLEEVPASTGRLRKSHSMNWNTIFYEVQHISTTERDPAPTNLLLYASSRAKLNDPTLMEPEILDLLDSYLRLVALLCSQSPVARSWLFSYPKSMLDLLIRSCDLSTSSRQRATAYSALQAFLPETSTKIWNFLDHWMSTGGASAPNLPRNLNAQLQPAPEDGAVLKVIGRNAEESNAFVRLLKSLVSPASDEDALRDSLPFPEHLGTANRMPGIEPYIDFVLGHVFAKSTIDARDAFQCQVLRLSCLEFVWTCLATFNEYLLIVANRSGLDVEAVIGCSSLQTYAQLHPFGRVMEWFFNESVLKSLFATAHQDVENIDKSPVDSPLVQSTLMSVKVIAKVLDLQTTYLDVVRPIIHRRAAGRKSNVADSTFSSFEDAILNNLQLVVDLGLYCGTGHIGLATDSLMLLEKLGSSRKLTASVISGASRWSGQNKILRVLEMYDAADRIMRPIVGQMDLNPRELIYGPDSPGVAIKARLLSFLIESLATSRNRPSMAHLFLGFQRNGDNIEVGHDSMFEHNAALFHTVLGTALDFPFGDENGFSGWLVVVKQAALHVLEQLWRAPLTSILTMTELRSHEFLTALIIRQPTLNAGSIFDGEIVSSPNFLITEAPLCLKNFLAQRISLLDYAARELRLVNQQQSPSLKSAVLSSLLGTSVIEGVETPNPSIFDMCDFLELDFAASFSWPQTRFFTADSFASCLTAAADELPTYDMDIVTQMLLLTIQDVQKREPPNTADQQQVREEAELVVQYGKAFNNRIALSIARLEVLGAWVQLLILMIESCDFDQGARTALILQALQVVLPKLEKYSMEDVPEAIELARLSSFLLYRLDLDSSAGRVQSNEAASDRLFQLFRISLRSIHSPVVSEAVREVFYNICYRYLSKTVNATSGTPSLRRYCMQAIKAAGDRLITVVSEDVYSGNGTSRVSAVLFLEALVALNQLEKSGSIVDGLVRINFLGLLVHSIKTMSAEIQAAGPQDLPLLLVYYKAKLSLLRRISQTRVGAGHVLSSGLFQSIRESHLFSADPDIGIDMDDPHALRKYYELLLWVTRIVSSTVLSRGAQNQQTIDQAKYFLAENRQLMVTVFKSQAKVGSHDTLTGGVLEGLEEQLLVLVRATNFLEYEDNREQRQPPAKLFS